MKDINPGSPYSPNPSNFIILIIFLYFSADNGIHGDAIWWTDSTEEGTKLVKDINPGQSYSLASNFIAFNNFFYFSAYDRIHGRELWKSDATTDGTELAKEIVSGLVYNCRYCKFINQKNLYYY